MLKRSGLKAKKNRIRRRFTNISGDFFAAMGLLIAIAAMSSLFIYAYNVLISRPYFEIKEISVRGLKELTEKEVLAVFRRVRDEIRKAFSNLYKQEISKAS